MFHLVNECDQARKSHTRARLYITACFKTIWHLHSGQDLVPLVSAIASKISMVQIKNAKKRTTKHCSRCRHYPHLPTYPSPLPHNPIALSNPPCDGSLKKKTRLVVDPKPPVFTAYPPVLKHDLLENPPFTEDFPIKPSICRGFSIAMLQHV